MLRIDKDIESQYAKDFMTEFSGKNSTPKYIYGINVYTDMIMKDYPVKGIIADKLKGDSYKGIKLVSVNEVENDALVVQVIRGVPVTEERKVKRNQFRTIDLFAFIRYSGKPELEIDFWQGFQEEFKKHRADYDRIHDRLADKASRDTFFNLVHFRLTHDLSYMKGFVYREADQYFEDFYSFGKNEVFVDVGGFDGFTTDQFVKRCPDYEKVYFFEPDEANVAKAKNLIGKYKNIEYMKYGLSNKNETLYFESSGAQSKVSQTGTNKIEVVRFSDKVKDRVTFIKIDIEGLEQEALEGCKESIEKYHPRLALAVYHKCHDMRTLFDYVLSIRNDYKVYLRHYNEGISETVMYFIPAN